MKKTDLGGLRQTVETLRRDLHPDLDAQFLAAVIAAEDEHPEPADESEALRQIRAALDEALAVTAAARSRKTARPRRGRR